MYVGLFRREGGVGECHGDGVCDHHRSASSSRHEKRIPPRARRDHCKWVFELVLLLRRSINLGGQGPNELNWLSVVKCAILDLAGVQFGVTREEEGGFILRWFGGF